MAKDTSYIGKGSRTIKFKKGQDIKWYRNMLNELLKEGYHVANLHFDESDTGGKIERRVLVSKKHALHRVYTVKLNKDGSLAQDFYLLEVQHSGFMDAE